MFLKIKTIPSTIWSSDHPLNFMPPFKTILFLVLGLAVFGFGSSLLIHSGIGNSPWVVLAEGLSIQLGGTIGIWTFGCSMVVLLAWIPLKEKPGLGTVLNILIIASVLDLSLFLFDFSSDNDFVNYLTASIGVIVVGIGSGIYLPANLGPGPRDGLMTGLQRVTGKPIAWVRSIMEITVVLLGWLLGGNAGIGTIFFAVGIGPAVALGLYLASYFPKKD